MGNSLTSNGLRRIVIFLAVTLLIGFLLSSACSGGSDNDGDDDDAMEPATSAAQATTAGSAAPPNSIAETSGGAATTSASDDSAGSGSNLAQTQGWEQRIIRTASVTLSVVEGDGGVNSAMTWVRDLATAKGGFVFSSNSYIEQDRQFAQITIQVPVEQFDQTMNDLRNAPFVDDVEREESSAQDVSAEFVDNESRLRALRETELRFLDLLSQADSVDDILRMEYELSNIRSQIETIQGRQNYLEQVTSFSTITVSLHPSGEVAEPQIAGDGFSLTRIAERAWEHSRGAIEDILIVTITLAIIGGAIAPFLVIAWIAYRVYRSWSARREAGGSLP